MNGESDGGLSIQEQNKEFIIQHFTDIIDRRKSEVALVNFSNTFVDHQPGGDVLTRPDEVQAQMEALYTMYPELHVIVEDVMAEDEIVVTRNVWHGKDTNGNGIRFVGIVMWEMHNGKITDRWAVITPPSPLIGENPHW